MAQKKIAHFLATYIEIAEKNLLYLFMQSTFMQYSSSCAPWWPLIQHIHCFLILSKLNLSGLLCSNRAATKPLSACAGKEITTNPLVQRPAGETEETDRVYLKGTKSDSGEK